MDYINSEPEFYRFLTYNEKITKATRTNYISWLRFLSQIHKIDESLSEEEIDRIISIEEQRKDQRNFYTKDKDLSNFKSSLRKYLKFLNEGFYESHKKIDKEEISKVERDSSISSTEKENIVLSRIGQGKFREKLIKYWQGDSIMNLEKPFLLIASHIKPWRVSNNIERLDYFNGLLLLPNFDKLFDKGYITFDNKGKIIISKFLDKEDRAIFNINTQIGLRHLSSKHFEYLGYHRENCFID